MRIIFLSAFIVLLGVMKAYTQNKPEKPFKQRSSKGLTTSPKAQRSLNPVQAPSFQSSKNMEQKLDELNKTATVTDGKSSPGEERIINHALRLKNAIK